MPWRTIEGETLAPATMPQLEVLLRGVFDKRRFLDLIRHFIVFDDDARRDWSLVLERHCDPGSTSRGAPDGSGVTFELWPNLAGEVRHFLLEQPHPRGRDQRPFAQEDGQGFHGRKRVRAAGQQPGSHVLVCREGFGHPGRYGVGLTVTPRSRRHAGRGVATVLGAVREGRKTKLAHVFRSERAAFLAAAPGRAPERERGT